ncbi:MAG: Sel1 domain protein repeat-containing protein [Rhodocyclales bacterium]|nr:Sel1 domain protein repeat-containing protein [Rhodocyclales bacterium]
MHSIISQRPDALANSRWRHLPMVLAAAGILGGMACVVHAPLLPPKDDLAKGRFLPSAKSGNAQDQYRLALSFRFGMGGVSKDLNESVSWLRKAAENHYEPAQVDLADGYLFGEFGLELNISKGLSQWRVLAEKGSANAPLRFAIRLSDTKNKWADREEAAKWFEIAAKRGVKYAAFKLAQQYESGIGISKDLTKALTWYCVSRASEDAIRLEAVMPSNETANAQAACIDRLRNSGELL